MNLLSVMNLQKRILILTSDSGFGHRSAANSVVKALEMQHPQETQTVVINPIIDQPSPLLLKKTELNYDQTVCKSPGFYRLSYEISNSRPASAIVESTLTIALYRNMQQIITEFQPDCILNTNLMFNAPTGAVKNLLKLSIPFHTVVTDLADVHSMWFNSNPDCFFVASEWVKTKAMSDGIAPEKIVISGIPVDPYFSTGPFDKARLRVSKDLDPDLTTILVVGSRRVNGILENLSALEKSDQPFQVIVIAGGDNQLYNDLAGRKWKFPILVKNFVNDIPQWMACADILVTKAGGLIISEGLAAGLPIVMIDNLPGQEEGNVRFVVEHQAGAMVENPMELLSLVESLMNDHRALLRLYTANSQKIGRPRSALEIAETLWQASSVRIPEPVHHRTGLSIHR